MPPQCVAAECPQFPSGPVTQFKLQMNPKLCEEWRKQV